MTREDKLLELADKILDELLSDTYFTAGCLYEQSDPYYCDEFTGDEYSLFKFADRVGTYSSEEWDLDDAKTIQRCIGFDEIEDDTIIIMYDGWTEATTMDALDEMEEYVKYSLHCIMNREPELKISHVASCIAYNREHFYKDSYEDEDDFYNSWLDQFYDIYYKNRMWTDGSEDNTPKISLEVLFKGENDV